MSYTPHRTKRPDNLALDVPKGGLTPAGLLDAYNATPLAKEGHTGKGETIVFFEFDGFDQKRPRHVRRHIGLAEVHARGDRRDTGRSARRDDDGSPSGACHCARRAPGRHQRQADTWWPTARTRRSARCSPTRTGGSPARYGACRSGGRATRSSTPPTSRPSSPHWPRRRRTARRRSMRQVTMPAWSARVPTNGHRRRGRMTLGWTRSRRCPR